MGSDADTSRRATRFVKAWLLALLVTQRLAVDIPGVGQLSLSLLILLALAGYGVAAGHLAPRLNRLTAFIWLSAVVSTIAWLDQMRWGSISVPALVLLISVYSVSPFRPKLGTCGADEVLRFFISLMLVASAVSLAQLGSQMLGVPYSDFLGQVLPPELLASTYNTANPITFGSDIYRSSAFIFLEPSFLSFFLGIGALAALHLRAPWWKALLICLGIVPTLAGNGIVIVLLGLPVLAVRGRLREVARLSLLGVVAALFALLTPLAELFVRRSSELSGGGSASLRLIEPYEALIPRFSSSTWSTFFGYGPGTSDAYLQALQPGVAVLNPYLTKLLNEYGLVGFVAFTLYLAPIVFNRILRLPWVAGVAFCFFALNASLAQPTFALATILFCDWLRDAGAGASAPPPEVLPSAGGAGPSGSSKMLAKSEAGLLRGVELRD
ncbi:hypothetical protein [Blastococcus sp. SYSU DS1024]